MSADTPTARIRRLIAGVQMWEGHLALPEGAVMTEIVNGAPRLSDAAKAVEIRQGIGSAERAAIENAGPVIENARSWDDVHRGLADVGLAYERKGSGAIIRVAPAQAVKATTVHRRASRGALEERLGPFVPAEPDVVVRFRPDQIAPGVKPELAAVLEEKREAATSAQAKYDHETSGLAQQPPMLVEAIFGRRPRQPGDAHHLASESALAAPVVAPIRVVPQRPDAGSPLGRLHAAVGADTYQLVGRNSTASRADLLTSRRGPIAVVAQDFEALQARATDMSVAMHSEQHLFFVIHGVSDRHLPLLTARGFRPRLVVRVAENDNQVLLTVRRSGLPNEDVAATEVQELLTRTHGRATRSGHAPEIRYPNIGRPPKSAGRRPRRVEPVVIHEGIAGVLCPRTAELLDQTRVRIESRPAQTVLKARSSLRDRLVDPRQNEMIALYEAHRREVHLVGRSRERPVNPSRIDGRIAQRLRATGHSREDIASIMSVGSRGVDPTRRRDWDAYGQAVADFAFSPTSTKVLDGLSRFIDDWRQLERRLIAPVGDEEPERKQQVRSEPVQPTPPAIAPRMRPPKAKVRKRQVIGGIDGPER